MLVERTNICSSFFLRLPSGCVELCDASAGERDYQSSYSVLSPLCCSQRDGRFVFLPPPLLSIGVERDSALLLFFHHDPPSCLYVNTHRRYAFLSPFGLISSPFVDDLNGCYIAYVFGCCALSLFLWFLSPRMWSLVVMLDGRVSLSFSYPSSLLVLTS